MSYNIHKGFNFGNKKFTLNEIRKSIQSVNADLVFLQEVQGENHTKSALHHEWPQCSHFEYLADKIWPHYAYGKNAVYPDGHHGNAILSKFPIESWQNFDISTNKLERRGALLARLTIPGMSKPVDCVSLHLNLTKSGRTAQMQRLTAILNEHAPKTEILIIGGDFNDWSLKICREMELKLKIKEAYKSLHGSLPRTFPSDFPILKLDRIYFRGVEVKDARIIKEKKNSSDHLALFAEFNVKIQ